MFINKLETKLVKSNKRSKCRAANRNKRCGRGNNGAKVRGGDWMSHGIQNGGQNPFYRMHGKIGCRSQLRKREKVKLIDIRSAILKLEKNVDIDSLNHEQLYSAGLINYKEFKSKVNFKFLNRKAL